MMALLGLLAVALIALAFLLGGPVVAEAVGRVLEAFLPGQVVAPLMVFLAIFVLVNVLLIGATMLTFAERRIVARMQNRVGPNRVGPQGLLQPFADLLKLATKEDLIPEGADRWVFNAAPVLAFVPTFMMYAVVPFHAGWVLADLDAGLVYLIAITSLGVFAIFMAGWASNNKYSLYGAIRAVAQLVSYEVPMVLAAASIVLLAGSMKLQDIVNAQGLPFILVQPLAFLIFLVAVTAELNRTPFDLMEAESEIVAGFHTEYSGMKFGLFYGSEYVAAFGWSAVMTTLFLGGWKPDLGGLLWFTLKSLALTFVFFWFRATWPRLRIDQLLGLAWKVLFPLATLNLLITAGEVLAAQALLGLRPGEGMPGVALVGMAAVNLGLTAVTLAVLPSLMGMRRAGARAVPLRGTAVGG